MNKYDNYCYLELQHNELFLGEKNVCENQLNSETNEKTKQIVLETDKNEIQLKVTKVETINEGETKK